MILVWRRLGAYFQKGLRLLDAAQAESLGGVQVTSTRSLSAPSEPEDSPDYPGNWTEPYDHLFAPSRAWRCEDWEIDAAAITVMGGGRRSNQELFGMEPLLSMGMVISSLADEAPDWRLPSTALAAGRHALRGETLNTLPCHATHLGGECQGPLRVEQALQESNKALVQWSQHRPGRFALSAGAALHFCCDQAWFCCLGDLHLYRWRAGGLTQLTTTLGTEPQPRPHPTQRSIDPLWSRYLGFREPLPLACHAASMAAGDYFLLASAGLHRTLSRHAMEQAIGEHVGDLEAACMRLSDIAWSSRHQRDDITLLLAHVKADRRSQRKQSAGEWRAQLERGLF